MKFQKKIISKQAFSQSILDKKKFFKKYINIITSHHYRNSNHYKNYLDSIGYKLNQISDIKNIPFIPVRLFKELDLISINKSNIFKTLFSSGTSANGLSKIYLDKSNALNQVKVLQKIFEELIGNSRYPMLVIDRKFENQSRNNFNASAAAINGFSIFAKSIDYLLDESNDINYKVLNNFLTKNSHQKFLIFGFTYNVYINLLKKLDPNKVDVKLFKKSILIHGGGWKKLDNLKVNTRTFNLMLKKKLNISLVRNYYGLIEQIGSIFFECKCGYFIPSNFSEIIIRDENLNECKEGEKGFIQLLSLLPTSYPGHSILTEDIGEIVNESNCKCFGIGKRFKVYGRLKNAEIRGCSNI
jgi:phenylacetate-coenzyme A ligase PaaK-like adenylate-forming protein